MTWTLPFLFIHFIVRSGIPVELAGVALRVLLTFFLGCLLLFFIQVAARRYLLLSYRAKMVQTYREGS
jgi:ACR3 family arsenite efflux pump ArsB